MSKFKFKVTTNVDTYITAKMSSTSITDNDVGKPVKLYTSKPDMYALCSDGDMIEGFIVGIDPATADGYPLATIQTGGRKRVEMEGSSTIGAEVEAGTVAAAGTAEANGLPMVSTHSYATSSVADYAASDFTHKWRIITANTSNGTVADNDTTAIIERI